MLIDRFDPRRGGAEHALALLAERLRGGGHEVLAFALSASPGAPAELRRLRPPPLPRGPRDRWLARASADAAREAGCDVTVGVRHLDEVDVYWPHGGSHAATLVAGERARGRVAGAVAHALHRLSPKHRVLLDLEEALLARGGAGRIWCVSSVVRDEIASAWPDCAARTEVHANGVDLDTFHPGLRDEHRDAVRAHLGIPDGQPVLLFLGGNWQLKGWAVLLEALAGLSNLRWTCVAAGVRHERAQLAAGRTGLGARVRVLPHQDPRPLYGAADLLVQPTWRDPCSLATLEALACGVPVVTTPANGASDALAGRTDAGAVVAPGDAAALAQALGAWIDALSDPVVRMRSRREAREAVRGRVTGPWLDGLVQSLGARPM